jgi:hypothetical protein
MPAIAARDTSDFTGGNGLDGLYSPLPVNWIYDDAAIAGIQANSLPGCSASTKTSSFRGSSKS